MQIPEALQHFPEPALIVTADHYKANLWLAFEDSLEEVESFEMPKKELSDNEGKGIGEELNDQERLKHFAHIVAERINQLIRDEEAAMNLHILAPADLTLLVKKQLAPEAANILGKELDVNVMKEDETSILERLTSA